MGRIYHRKPGSRKYRDYGDERLKAAVDTYKKGGRTLHQVAEEYGIPYVTIYRKAKGLHKKTAGGQPALPRNVENIIVKAILAAADWGYAMEMSEIQEMVAGYLEQFGMNFRKFKNNKPGKDWYEGFQKRHQILAQRRSQSIKLSRAKVSPEDINKYFDNLEVSLQNVLPECIVNYDESNFTDDPGRNKVLVRRTSKRAEKVMDSSKSATSVMMAGTASGVLLPVYIVYKSEHLWRTWMEDGPPHARYNRSTSGWFDTNLFTDWFMEIALPYFRKLPNGPKALLGDNLASHLTIPVIQKCLEHDIRFVFLPPNSTHLTQPLDVAVFAPMKKKWREQLKKWKTRNKGTMRKDVFPRLLRKSIESLQEKLSDNIIAGFRGTGIFPLDRQQVLKRLPSDTVEDCASEPAAQAMVATLTTMFKEARYGKGDAPARGRKKKINVAPGRSVSAEDIEDIDTPSTSKGLARKSGIKRRQKLPASDESSDSDFPNTNAAVAGQHSDTDDDITQPIRLNRKYHPWDSGDTDLEASDNFSESGGSELVENEGADKVEDETDCDSSSTVLLPTLKPEDFVIVELGTTKGAKKKFAAKILSIEDGNQYWCSFLRPHQKIKDAFVFPNIDDLSLVQHAEIKKRLAPILKLRRGGFQFPGQKF